MNDTGMAELTAVLDQRIGTYVKKLEHHIIGAKTAALRPLGITVPQYAALLSTRHLQPTSAAQLARTGLGTPQTVATMLANLEGKGLIERQVSPIHQKLVEVRLTDAGADLTDHADRIASAIERRLRQAVGDGLFAHLAEIERIVESALADE